MIMRFLLLSLIGITLISCSKTGEYRAAMKDDTTRMSVQKGNSLQIVRSDSVAKTDKDKIDQSPDTATFEMGKGKNNDHEK